MAILPTIAGTLLKTISKSGKADEDLKLIAALANAGWLDSGFYGHLEVKKNEKPLINSTGGC